jgi:anaerobic magnesium-protoporphyrin IX monomethyl ester cyclase
MPPASTGIVRSATFHGLVPRASASRPPRVIFADNHGPVLGREQTSANLSLLYLASYLRGAFPGAQVEYISQSPPIEHHLRRVKELQPDFYALSFTSFAAAEAYALVRTLKDAFPKLRVVCGGPHVTARPEDVLRRGGADVAVIGEGEVTLAEIVRAREHLCDALPRINGIGYLRDGEYIETPARATIEDLDSIPFPDRDLLNQDEFCGLTYSRARPNTEMVITRGCPYRCVFCANPVFRLKSGPLYRSRSPRNIAAEAEDLYRRGYREIYLHSDELNVRLDWSIDVCNELAALNHPDLFFQCNMRVEPMSEDFADALKRANFWLVRLGVESASDRVLTGIKKRMSLAKTERACEMLSRRGIKVFAFLMMFNLWEDKGTLQHESAQEVKDTIALVYRLWRQRKLHYSSWQFAVPVPGAELYDIALRRGMIDADYIPNDAWDAHQFLQGISKAEFNRLYARARRQQAIMALTSGCLEWRNWKGILHQARTTVFGKHERQPQASHGL